MPWAEAFGTAKGSTHPLIQVKLWHVKETQAEAALRSADATGEGQLIKLMRRVVLETLEDMRVNTSAPSSAAAGGNRDSGGGAALGIIDRIAGAGLGWVRG